MTPFTGISIDVVYEAASLRRSDIQYLARDSIP